jgi:hypothetical protein
VPLRTDRRVLALNRLASRCRRMIRRGGFAPRPPWRCPTLFVAVDLIDAAADRSARDVTPRLTARCVTPAGALLRRGLPTPSAARGLLASDVRSGDAAPRRADSSRVAEAAHAAAAGCAVAPAWVVSLVTRHDCHPLTMRMLALSDVSLAVRRTAGSRSGWCRGSAA